MGLKRKRYKLSRWEGFGLALPEYMMAGKPIVATKVDAIPNIIKDGENGILVKVDDAVGASRAVIDIFKDADLKNKLISGGTASLKKFDAKRVSIEHQKLFERIRKKEKESLLQSRKIFLTSKHSRKILWPG